jgi:hypothetical protein
MQVNSVKGNFVLATFTKKKKKERTKEVKKEIKRKPHYEIIDLQEALSILRNCPPEVRLLVKRSKGASYPPYPGFRGSVSSYASYGSYGSMSSLS